MENNQQPQFFEPAPANMPARIINIINVSALIVMVLLCAAIESGGIIAFFIGCILALYNFISMIIYITQKNVAAYVSNIIWMLLMPIIGFGCCAATFSLHGI